MGKLEHNIIRVSPKNSTYNNNNNNNNSYNNNNNCSKHRLCVHVSTLTHDHCFRAKINNVYRCIKTQILL